MQTALAESVRGTSVGREADAILRACVHCGFCNATCPTYQLLGDELDGPRGRIYLIKQLLEGKTPTAATQLHLDRCLTCRACETTCPSGVQYGRLLDIGRQEVERQVTRPWPERLLRRALLTVLPYRRRLRPLLRLGQLVRPLLPPPLRDLVPRPQPATSWPSPRHPRRVLLLEGCVQPLLAPNINAATARVLDRLGISVEPTPAAGCCGAMSHHLSDTEAARAAARRNVDAWWPALAAGAEAIVMTASGCGVHVKDYGHLLRDDPNYGAKAQHVADLTRDLSEFLADQDVSPLKLATRRIAFQAPCTLQHGQKLNGKVEQLLRRLGAELTPVAEPHLCCGSAGTYSLLQPKFATALRERKLQALAAGNPAVIATANIGCLAHLQRGTATPVRHWIELLEGA